MWPFAPQQSATSIQQRVEDVRADRLGGAQIDDHLRRAGVDRLGDVVTVMRRGFDDGDELWLVVL